MSIATKTGDNGTTGLLFNRRVPKNHPRIVANGACDELNASLGLARAWNDDPLITEALFAVQKELVTIMGEIACAEEDRERYVEKGFQYVGEDAVDRLTGHVEHLEKNHAIRYTHWATPGATQGAAQLDQARVVCRRAERSLIDLRDAGVPVRDVLLRYFNRLSDLCWLYARYVETKAGVA